MSEQPKEEKKQVEEKTKEESKKPDEEKTKEELIAEIKNLRMELEKLNEEKEMVEADNQMKAMNISFLEQTNVLQNNRINEYRKTIAQMKQEIEDLKKMKADEYFQKKDEETKEEEEKGRRDAKRIILIPGSKTDREGENRVLGIVGPNHVGWVWT